jgi:hypothetical protein
MHVGALLPIAIFGVVATSVGIRLMRLWWQTRELPELAIGLGMMLVSLVSMPLVAVSRTPQMVATPTGRLLFSVGMSMAVAAIVLFWLFDWRVFRPRARWAAALFVVAAGGLVACWAGMVHAEHTGHDLAGILSKARPFSVGLLLLLSLNYVWGGVESLIYYGTLRRRLSIGLVDAVLVNRFLLWGVASLTTAFLCISLLYGVLRGVVIARDPVALYTIALAGVVMSVTWYLTFFAPERYRRWVRERASGGGAASGSSGQA